MENMRLPSPGTCSRTYSQSSHYLSKGTDRQIGELRSAAHRPGVWGVAVGTLQEWVAEPPPDSVRRLWHLLPLPLFALPDQVRRRTANGNC